MSSSLYLAFGVVIIILVSFIECGKKSWDYSILQVQSSSTDPSAFDWNMRANRISRGVYGIHGNFSTGKGLDDDFSGQIQLLRSHDNSGHYQLYPYGIPETKISDFMIGPYKRYLMSSVKDCSDLPQIDVKTFPGTLPPKVYNLNNCLVKQDELPDYMSQGYYKVVVHAKRVSDPNFNAYLNITVKVDPKIGF